MDEPRLPTPSTLVLLVVVILGLIGNSLSTYVYSHKSLASSTSEYLRALSLYSILKLLNDMVFTTALLIGLEDQQTEEMILDKYHVYGHYIHKLTQLGTAWTIAEVTVDRYLQTCKHPSNRLTKICTIKSSRKVILITFLSSIGISIVYSVVSNTIKTQSIVTSIPKMYQKINTTSFLSDLNTTSSLDYLTDFLKRISYFQVRESPPQEAAVHPESPYTFIMIGIHSIIPLFVISIANVGIIKCVKKCKHRGVRQMKWRIATMLVTISILFSVCCLPETLVSILEEFPRLRPTLVKFEARPIADILVAIYCAVTAVIYTVTDCRIRRVLGKGGNRCDIVAQNDAFSPRNTTNIVKQLKITSRIKKTRSPGSSHNILFEIAANDAETPV